MLAMIILSLGVLISSWPGFVSAVDYTVKGTVLGVAPTQPATITTPTEGAVFTEVPITVQGTCPVDTYVVLYRNTTFSGVTNCAANGTFTMQTDLFKGTNQLQTRVFNHADVPGPYSGIVTVTYNPPVVVTPAVSVTGGGTGTVAKPALPSQAKDTAPLVLKTDYEYKGYYTGDLGTWQIAIDGGEAPYAISVDWGDGKRELISRTKAGAFNLEHVYNEPGIYQGSYNVLISASDSRGAKTTMQLLAVINDPPAGAGTAKRIGTSGVGFTIPEYLRGLLQYVWPTYGLVVLMFVCFWLGERREYEHLKPFMRRHHHA
jgi:hypothetical protein